MTDIYVAEETDFEIMGRKVIAINDIEIGVFRLNNGFVAYENNCVHQGGPVCQGKIINRVVELLAADKTSQGSSFSEDEVHIVCPWHGYEYNLKTGCHPGERLIKLKSYPVKTRDGGVFVVL